MSFDLTTQQLESLFEFYEQNKPREASSRPSRHYKPGRVYGHPGEYGDKAKEERYQSFISNDELVNKTFDEYIDELENSVPAPNIYDNLINGAAAAAAGAADGAASDDYGFDNYMASNYYASIYDSIRFETNEEDEDEEEDEEDEEDNRAPTTMYYERQWGVYDEQNDEEEEEEEEPRVVMRIIARPTPLEEGEIVEDENSSAGALDVYPNDLLEPEPFIRAPIASYEATEAVYNEFYAPTNPRALEYLNNRRYYYERTEADILRERLENFQWRNGTM